MFIVEVEMGDRMGGMELIGFVLGLRGRHVEVVVMWKILDLEEERTD